MSSAHGSTTAADAIAAEDAAALLARLAGLPAADRPAALRAAGDPSFLLPALAAAAQHAAAADAGQGLALARWLCDLGDDAGDPASRSELHSLRAAALAYAGEFDDALAASALAARVADEAGLPVAAARARLGEVHPLASLGRFPEALSAAEDARDAFLAHGEPALAGRAEINLGAVHDMAGDAHAALACFDRARALLPHDPATLAQLDSNRGLALIALDEYDAAVRAFEDAVAVFDAEGLDWAAAVAEENLAYLAVRQGRLQAALRHFERGRRHLERDDAPVHLARLLIDQAEAFAAIGMPEQALAAWESLLPDLDARGLAAEAAQSRAEMGRLLLRAGRADEAAAALEAAADGAAALGLADLAARIEALRAERDLLAGDPAAAERRARAALAGLADRPVQAIAPRETLARAALAAGRPADALAELEAALPVAEERDLAPMLADLRHLRGIARRDAGDPAGALEDFRAAVAQVERVRGALQAERFRSAWLGNRLAPYEDAVSAALDANDVAAAFGIAEAARSRALLDRLGGALDLDVLAASAAGDDPAEARLLADLAHVRAELEWRYSDLAEDAPGDRASTRRDAVRRLETDLAALEGRLAAASGVAGLYAPPVDLEGALALVPAGSALVAYFAAGDDLVAFVLRDGQAATVAPLASVAAVRAAAERLGFQVSRALAMGPEVDARRGERMLADARRELGALHGLLLAPLLPIVGDAERIVVAPHGPLHGLPFAALWDGEAHLVERREVVTVPSASVLGRLAPERAAGPPLVVGVPDAAAPSIGEEAAAVAAMLPDARLLAGDAATVPAVTAAARDASLVHLACHGRFDPATPQASGLALADRWLTARDVSAMRLRARLVTLSGCETGRAVVSAGDELAGLVRATLAAGASSLIYSLWLAHDRTTTELMLGVYRSLVAGDGPAAALRSAQRDALSLTPHPAFWAHFVLGGHP